MINPRHRPLDLGTRTRREQLSPDEVADRVPAEPIDGTWASSQLIFVAGWRSTVGNRIGEIGYFTSIREDADAVAPTKTGIYRSGVSLHLYSRAIQRVARQPSRACDAQEIP